MREKEAVAEVAEGVRRFGFRFAPVGVSVMLTWEAQFPPGVALPDCTRKVLTGIELSVFQKNRFGTEAQPGSRGEEIGKLWARGRLTPWRAQSDRRGKQRILSYRWMVEAGCKGHSRKGAAVRKLAVR